MVTALALLVVLLTGAVIPLAVNVVRYKRDKRERGLGRPWHLPQVPVEALDPVFRPGPLGPTLETEVAFVGRFTIKGVTGGTTDFEAWILAVLSKRARLAFEFGTATGKTTYLMARNGPPDGRVVTLTLPPEGVSRYTFESGDDAVATRCALAESAHARFLYTGTCVESRITQLYGDSKDFDEGPYVGQCDLVFVDGSHAYSYVMSDSRKALRMVAPGGIILWHDYRGPRRCGDVYRALNELSREIDLVHVRGTWLVAYRHPA